MNSVADKRPVILIVDDDPDCIHELGSALSDFAMVRVALSGQEALDIIQSELNRPDLILLDILMPEMNGYETCRRIRNLPFARETPIIFITSLVTPRDEVKALEGGALDFISKPVQLPIVARKVANHLDLIRLHGQSILQTQDQLHTAEEAYRALLQALPDVVMRFDLQGRYLFVSDNVENMVGLRPSQFIGKTVRDFGYPQRSCTLWEESIQTVVKSALPLETEFTFQGKDGLVFHNWRLVPEFDGNGQVRSVMSISRDITEHKKIVAQLSKNEELHNASQQLAHVGGWEWDVDNRESYWTAETFRIHDYSPEEAVQGSEALIQRSLDCYTPESRPIIWKAFQLCINQGISYDLELPFVSNAGRQLWVRTTARALLKDGRVAKVVGNIMDITRRKKTELLLQARLRLSELSMALSLEELLQRILDEAEALTGSQIGFFHFLEKDQQTLRLQTWSANTFRSNCTSPGQGLHYSIEKAGVWGDCIRERRPVIHNDYASLPHRKGMPQGHVPVFRELVVPIFLADLIVAVFGVGNKPLDYDELDIELISSLGELAWDIVLRRQAQTALRESEERFRGVFDISSMGIAIVETDSQRFLKVNASFLKIVGYTEEELLCKNVSDITHPEDREREQQRILQKIQNPDEKFFIEKRYIRKDGDIRWVQVTGDYLRSESGQILTIGNVIDVTESKFSEAALQKSEAMFRLLTLLAPIGIYLADPNGLCIYANPKCCEMAGLTVGEALGEGWIQSLHPDDRTLVLSAWQEMIESEGQWGREYRFQTPDGKITWVYGLAAPQKDATGTITGYVGINQDITERKQSEETMRASLAEKDVLLREVHHRVKNNLAAIIGLLELQRKSLSDHSAQTTLAELSGRIRSMSLVHEKLYRSESLSEINFQDYIRNLVSHLRTSFGSPLIRCEIHAEGVNMPLDLAVPCGMIINELVTNALKYAFPDGSPAPDEDSCNIVISLTHEQGVYTLTVADNGLGLPKGFNFATVKTLGLVMVRMLGQHQLGGQFEFFQEHGTRVRLVFQPRQRSKFHV
jgi:PAS domain S-box-containing protein